MGGECESYMFECSSMGNTGELCTWKTMEESNILPKYPGFEFTVSLFSMGGHSNMQLLILTFRLKWHIPQKDLPCICENELAK